MNTIRRLAARGGSLLTAAAFLLAVAAPVLVTESAFAAGQFSPRMLTMGSQASGSVSTDANGTAVPAGEGGNGAQTNHKFDFTTSASQTVGSLVFQYCTTPIFGTTCTAPAGLDDSTVTAIASISGFAATAPALDTTTDATTTNFFGIAGNACTGTLGHTNCILMKRTTPVADSGALSVSFGNASGWIKNPTSVGTFYVRITTFSDNTYSTVVDQGAVAGSVNTAIDITAKVQEKLNFSVAGAWAAPNATCDALSGTGAVQLGDTPQGVLDFNTAYDAHSYFRMSTNASNGTSVLYSGNTLKSAQGTTIAAINSGTGTKALSAKGTEQFGLALDSGDANQSLTNLVATTNYNAGNGSINPTVAAQFAFDANSKTAPVAIASVASGTVVSCDTGSVRYVGNIATTTKAGIYKTTISYIAVPNF